MDTFNDAALSPQELQMLTLQFMGQHLTGDLKELDKNLVAKNPTLKGMELNPAAVLNSITAVTAPQQQQQQQQPSPQLQSVALLTPALEIPAAIQSNIIQPVADQNQLEFSFEVSPLSVRIFETLERLEKKVNDISSRLAVIEDVLNDDTKKKD